MKQACRMKLTYTISELTPYINWSYFFFAWQVKDEGEKHRLQAEARDMLVDLEGKYHAHALFELYEANGDGDDIVLHAPISSASPVPTSFSPVSAPFSSDVTSSFSDSVLSSLYSSNISSQIHCNFPSRIPLLRQQHPAQETAPCLCLSDFLRPLSSGILDRVGVFATSVDSGLETDFASDAYRKMMAQLLADRLAEAAAERMHEQVRKTYWRYAPDENLSIAEMQAEKFQGIRPAVGYPSLPDTSLNFLLDGLLDMSQIGIHLTESGAMRPHASVSGLMLAHPQSRYFSLGRIGDDQLHDYARRRNLPVPLLRKFLAGNLE